MSYKYYSPLWLSGAMFASTYGSELYSDGAYNGTAAAPQTPFLADPITLGPITLPVTGAQLVGVILIAASAALLVWVYQSRKKRLKQS